MPTTLRELSELIATHKIIVHSDGQSELLARATYWQNDSGWYIVDNVTNIPPELSSDRMDLFWAYSDRLCTTSVNTKVLQDAKSLSPSELINFVLELNTVTNKGLPDGTIRLEFIPLA